MFYKFYLEFLYKFRQFLILVISIIAILIAFSSNNLYAGDGKFYIAAKLTYTRQQLKVGPTEWEVPPPYTYSNYEKRKALADFRTWVFQETVGLIDELRDLRYGQGYATLSQVPEQVLRDKANWFLENFCHVLTHPQINLTSVCSNVPDTMTLQQLRSSFNGYLWTYNNLGWIQSETYANSSLTSEQFWQQKMTELESTPNYEDIQDYGFRYLYGYQVPLSGGTTNSTHFSGALAFGVDFYNIWKIPVRMELEASLPYYGYKSEAAKDNIIRAITFQEGAQTYNTNTEIVYRTDIKYKIFTSFLNLYIDGHFFDDFTPYIGGGIGLSNVKVNILRPIAVFLPFYSGALQLHQQFINTNYDDQDFEKNNLAWHITFGVTYKLYKNIDIDFSYRYQDLGYKEKLVTSDQKAIYGDAPIFGKTEVDLSDSDQVQLALRFSF